MYSSTGAYIGTPEFAYLRSPNSLMAGINAYNDAKAVLPEVHHHWKYIASSHMVIDSFSTCYYKKNFD